MFCWSQTSCNERYQDHPYWMSSTQWSPEMAQGGIFATDGSSPWGTANRVFVKYCRCARAALRALRAPPTHATRL